MNRDLLYYSFSRNDPSPPPPLQTFKILLRVRRHLGGRPRLHKLRADTLPIPFSESLQTEKKTLVFTLRPGTLFVLNAFHDLLGKVIRLSEGIECDGKILRDLFFSDMILNFDPTQRRAAGPFFAFPRVLVFFFQI